MVADVDAVPSAIDKYYIQYLKIFIPVDGGASTVIIYLPLVRLLWQLRLHCVTPTVRSDVRQVTLVSAQYVVMRMGCFLHNLARDRHFAS